MTTLTDLQLVNVRWNEASTAIATGQNLADLDNLPVTFNTKTVTGYVIGDKDGAKVVVQIQLLDAVYIPIGAVLDITPVDTLVVAPPIPDGEPVFVGTPTVEPIVVNLPDIGVDVFTPTIEGGETA